MREGQSKYLTVAGVVQIIIDYIVVSSWENSSTIWPISIYMDYFKG